jgi:Fe-S cluster assembly ATPase SufC
MIKRLLGMLNTSIQKYIIDLGMTMRCKFDEYFDEKITNDNGKDISYWNFSGGERRTVDLACAWAFKDIKRKISGVSSNVEFLDEIFDSAFDERGLDLLIEVLKERIEHSNLSCYAISHRKETLKHVDGEIVELEKENKITRRI